MPPPDLTPLPDSPFRNQADIRELTSGTTTLILLSALPVPHLSRRSEAKTDSQFPKELGIEHPACRLVWSRVQIRDRQQLHLFHLRKRFWRFFLPGLRRKPRGLPART